MYHFPVLDCHAHVAPDVTSSQVRTLSGALVFAMTRSVDEFDAAVTNPQDGLLWGIGTHPGVPAALTEWSAERFHRSAKDTILIGEVGLDRGGNGQVQARVLEGVLRTPTPALTSIHSTGRTRQVIELIERNPRPGVILHWFAGDREDIERATAAGCYFSINAAMTDEQMTALPLDRILPETDFPSARSRTKARTPGDIRALEHSVVRLTRQTPDEVRRRWYENLGALVASADVANRLPRLMGEAIEAAQT